MSDIPPEIEAQIQAFKAEEAERADKKASDRAGRLRKKDLRESAPRRQMNARKIESLASQRGITVETGGGRHGCHLVAPDGSFRPLPDHPGNLATGTCCSLMKWIEGFPIKSKN